MSQLKDLFSTLNIAPENLEQLANTLKSNPFAAMSLIQELNIPPDFLQKVMTIAMTDPNAIRQFASEMGISDKQFDEIKSKVTQDK